ncbi:hypothetical protein CORC01_10585 [Colletotrichum orchidophilum]|uniref:Uncharacterized protein n=1 Tax=Colletotrichum orchidophilum TaxID=1209926 RepID=A0A1G4AY86_9PEZI|nr:uncharacterized protein CORC01_10585 [Colletotrichum orchidophilum]OHE94128.1 hypothetical protein CORC01_10585 [Colletotrichum orchidophilum]
MVFRRVGPAYHAGSTTNQHSDAEAESVVTCGDRSAEDTAEADYIRRRAQFHLASCRPGLRTAEVIGDKWGLSFATHQLTVYPYLAPCLEFLAPEKLHLAQEVGRQDPNTWLKASVPSTWKRRGLGNLRPRS